MACHVWKGWEGFGRFEGALVNSTDCLAVLDGFVGSAVTNLYFCNTYLCCFNGSEGNRLGSNISFQSYNEGPLVYHGLLYAMT